MHTRPRNTRSIIASIDDERPNDERSLSLGKEYWEAVKKLVSRAATACSKAAFDFIFPIGRARLLPSRNIGTDFRLGGSLALPDSVGTKKRDPF